MTQSFTIHPIRCGDLLVTKNTESTWAKPELVKLGTLKDVANGSQPGNDSNGNGAAVKLS